MVPRYSHSPALGGVSGDISLACRYCGREAVSCDDDESGQTGREAEHFSMIVVFVTVSFVALLSGTADIGSIRVPWDLIVQDVGYDG